MKQKLLSWLAVGGLGLGMLACSPQSEETPTNQVAVEGKKAEFSQHYRVETPTIDAHSFANSDQVRTQHLKLHLTVDFEGKRVLGYAEHTLDYVAEGKQRPEKFVLDTEELFIEHVEALYSQTGETWQRVDFELGEADIVLGTPLMIDLQGQPEKVRVHYASSPQATGLDWVEPEGTAGGEHPFLYSQSQPHYARTWIPIQDTPAVRFTFEAELFTPKHLLGVMGANNGIKNGQSQAKTGHYHFVSRQPIPSYLMALAVGDLEFKALDERVGIFAEPAVLESAAKEFSYTPAMIEATEAMFGTYAWDRYDLLILPPSFPFGGMENPQLSFITPTAIAGDQSLVGLIAHELAHSWSGNLVTNETWRDIWLNEGFTSYVENRIMEQVYGQSRADMERMLDGQALANSIGDLPERYQVLYIDLEQRDPDTAFTRVPYIKAQQFLFFLEARFGRDIFDAFVRQYFEDFAFESLGTLAFEAYLKEQLLDKYPGKVTEAEVKNWLYGSGLPATQTPKVSAFEQVDQVRAAWLADENAESQTDLQQAELQKTQMTWSIHERLYFLQNMPAELTLEQMARLDQIFQLTATKNNQLLSVWLVMAIQQHYEPALARVPEMLQSMGRLVFILPVYQALAETEAGLQQALDIYSTARAGYHHLTRIEVEALLEQAQNKND